MPLERYAIEPKFFSVLISKATMCKTDWQVENVFFRLMVVYWVKRKTKLWRHIDDLKLPRTLPLGGESRLKKKD